jgi:hypothetical protein
MNKEDIKRINNLINSVVVANMMLADYKPSDPSFKLWAEDGLRCARFLFENYGIEVGKGALQCFEEFVEIANRAS